jgi:polar amino acid transport system substrate-binding protein
MNHRPIAAVLAILALVLAGCAADTAEPDPAPTEQPGDDDTDTGTDDGDDAAAGEGCTPDELPTLTAETLTFATGDPAFPPWVENDDPASGEGFEAAVAYELAEELGYSSDQVAWVRTGFDEAIAPGPKDYDLNLQQYSIIEERREVVDLTVPYYQPDKAIVALPGTDVVNATSFEELRDARWGATIGTTDLRYIEEILGVTDVSVYDDQAGTFQALQAGQIDATVVALPTALFATAVQVPEATISAVLPPDQGDDGLGLLLQKDSPLTSCVDQALERLREAGVLDELATTWLGVGGDIPEITE